MAGLERIFPKLVSFYFLCLVIAIVLSRRVQGGGGSSSSTPPPGTRPILGSPEKAKNPVFDLHHRNPAKSMLFDIKFPNTPERKGVDAQNYANKLMKEVPKFAQKEDPNLKMTGESCAHGLGSLYVVKSDEGTILYSVCFNDATASAIYSTHTISLSGQQEPEHSSHISFKEKYTLAGWKPTKVTELYSAENQTEAFNAVFIPFTNADYKMGIYLSRNHLTPHADFMQVKDQKLTYFFQNCFPGMQSMNGQNWAKVEAYGRSLSIEMKETMHIHTGVYGILKKKTKKGEMKNVYLDLVNQKIEVPLVVWKLVTHAKTQATIAFFTSNDTDMDEKEIKRFSTLCNSVCDEFGYKFNNENVSAGYTLCCSYEDFAKHIKF
ncbi:uncharacterized protein LOC129573861 [Sitodiplosis mosellana]|uniref:uncharacterized protein LOC129573861 n=1 Tax=Sitodiplosis mosellana TaxID=263140 RepID=UPI002444E5FA|nr:uncharacterized protein LOC129573861 [Sitodiplosis mosellana]